MSKTPRNHKEEAMLVSILRETNREDVSEMIHNKFATLGHTYTREEDDETGDITWEFFSKSGGEPLENKIYLEKNVITCHFYNDMIREYKYDVDEIEKMLDDVEEHNDESWYQQYEYEDQDE
jgi:hypothetical protein